MYYKYDHRQRDLISTFNSLEIMKRPLQDYSIDLKIQQDGIDFKTFFVLLKEATCWFLATSGLDPK